MLLDRLLRHSYVLTLRSDSYRLRAKRKSGLIKLPGAGGAAVGPTSVLSAAEQTFNRHHEPEEWGAGLHDKGRQFRMAFDTGSASQPM
ncbi:hypothetical protein AB7M49_004140 [Bradyrhizobium elkanii]